MSKPDSSTSGPKPRYFPPRWVLAIVALCLLGLALEQTAILWADDAPDGIVGVAVLHMADQATANIARLCLAAGVVFWPLLWFITLSSYPRVLRLIVLLVIAGGVGGFFSYFELAGVGGDLIPRFQPRGAKAAYENLEAPEVAVDRQVDVRTATDHDFPQFLGPHRNLVVEGVHLAREWKQPPRRLWSREIGAGWSGFAVVNGFAVTMEQRGDEELITCYDVTTGKPQWFHAVKAQHLDVQGGDGPRATPTIYDGKVLAQGATGILRCLDGETGELLWMHDLPEMYGLASHDEDMSQVPWGRSGSPLVYDDLVVVPAGGPGDNPTSLVAFEIESGKRRWEAGKWQISYASPALAVLDGVRQVLSVNEGFVSGHDPTDGTVLWSCEWPSSTSTQACSSQPVVLPGNRILLTKGYALGAMLIKVEQEKGQWQTTELWRNRRVLKTKFTNVTVNRDSIFGLSESVLECVDAETGERNWKGARYGYGQILLVDDLLLVQAEDGRVALVEASPKGFIELGTFPALDGKTWSNLSLYGPYLLVRNATQSACYQLPVETGSSDESDKNNESND